MDSTGDARRLRGRVLFWTGVLLVLVFLVLQVSPLVSRVTGDEVTVIYDAHRLVQGEVPYRDFFTMWPPVGNYVLSGGPWGWWGRPETGTRYLQVFMLLAVTILIAFCLKKANTPGLIEAMVVPLVLFPMVPFMGNHWLSVFLYCGAILVAAKLWRDPESHAGWYWLGAIAMTAGCTMQTEGILGIVLIGFTALTTSPDLKAAAGRALRSVAGGALACALWLGPLFFLGAGRSFLRDVFWWPFKNYRKPGNIVDFAYLYDLPGRLRNLWAANGGETALYKGATAGAGTLLTVAVLVGILAAASLSLFYLGRVLLGRSRIEPGLTAASVLTLLGLGMYAHVNPTWVHAVYAFTPVFLLWCLVGVSRLGSKGRLAWKILLGVLLVAGVLFNCRAYWGRPHHLWEYTDVDKLDRESPLNRSLRALPFMKKGDTIAVLPAGARTYLYTYPAAIGYSYLFALEDGQYDLADHRRAASEIARRRPKLVLIDRIKEKDFLSPADPISRVIRAYYRRWAQTPSVSVYRRMDLMHTAAAAASPQKKSSPDPGGNALDQPSRGRTDVARDEVEGRP